MVKKNPYNQKVLLEIKRNTKNNAHTKNIYYVAKVGNLSTKNDAKKLYNRVEKRGYRDSKDVKEASNIYAKNIREVDTKYGFDTGTEIHKRL